MKSLNQLVLGGSIALLLAYAVAATADGTNETPDFKEVYDLIRSNLAGQTDADLNQAAVRGLLDQLHSKVGLVSGHKDGNTQSNSAAAIPSFVYDGGIGCLRIGEVSDGLADRIAAAQKGMAATNTNALRGLILDLRFAGGADYQAAATAAGLFISKGNAALLDWGDGVVQSKANSDAVSLPLVVLVNKQTAGAAEALAAVLREGAHAVLLGSDTAGETIVGRNFPLKNGQYLRIATASIKLGGGEVLSAGGVKPDIQVTVRPEDEKLYYADPFKDLAATANAGGRGNSGLRASSPRLSEADLIRERKERPGMDLEFMPEPDSESGGSAAKGGAGEKPVVHDPALGRALDLIKGISAFRRPRTL